MHSPRVYFNNIGYICTDSLRLGNGLSALLLLTRAAKSSPAKSSATKTRSMESRNVFWSGFGADFVCACSAQSTRRARAEHAQSTRRARAEHAQSTRRARARAEHALLLKMNASTMNIAHVSMGADCRAD